MDEQQLIGLDVDDVPKREADENCNARRTRSGVFKGYCKRTSGWGTDSESGRCSSHGGASSGAPEGNTNAVDVGAWAEDFYEGFLTEAEKDRVHKSAEALGDESSAQKIAQHAASVCLEQFRRTGDERFLRRYESIMDTFNLAPDDESDDSVDVNIDVNTLSSEEKDQLDAVLDRDVQG
jgi:hypothetical protein